MVEYFILTLSATEARIKILLRHESNSGLPHLVADVQVTYHSGDEGTGLGGNSKISKETKQETGKKVRTHPDGKRTTYYPYKKGVVIVGCIILGGNGRGKRDRGKRYNSYGSKTFKTVSSISKGNGNST